MGDMENQAEFYYEKLKSQANPGLVLLEFFREMTGLEGGRSEIIMINRLIKLFGRFTVYFSIMDLSKNDKLSASGNLYSLLYTICRSRFEKIHSDTFSPAYESLERVIGLIEKEAEKVRKASAKMKVPSSEGL